MGTMAAILILLNLLVMLTFATTIDGEPSPWWAKPITEDLSTAGCLTKSQIKQVKEAGFKSVISMFNSATEEQIGDQKYPSTSEEEQTVRELGMDYGVVLDINEFDWMTLSTLRRFSEIFPTLPKPVLFHCMTAYSATFISLLYFVNSTRHETGEAVTMDAQGMLKKTATMGFDYSMDDAPLQMLREISGNHSLQLDIKPKLKNPVWNFGFWPMKPIVENWNFIEELHSSQFKTIKDNDIDMIIHVQSGHSQEGVPEQTPEPPPPTENHSGDKPTKHPDLRHMECTDNEGGLATKANTPDDSEAARALGITLKKYALVDLDVNAWLNIKNDILNAGERHSGILVHGDSQLALTVALLAAGCQYGYNSTWAIEKAHGHGYAFTDYHNRDDQRSTMIGGFIGGLRRWSPLLADISSVLAAHLGFPGPILPECRKFADGTDDHIFQMVLDNSDTMC